MQETEANGSPPGQAIPISPCDHTGQWGSQVASVIHARPCKEHPPPLLGITPADDRRLNPSKTHLPIANQSAVRMKKIK
jgi:hypothetical protein